MFRKKRIWLGLIAVVLVGGAAVYFYSQNLASASAQTEEEATVQTAVARRGELVVSAIGAGTIVADQELTLGFSTSGTLTDLQVEVGDEVAAGDVLARIDDATAQQALVNAQLQYQRAAMQTDSSVTQTGVSYDDISVAQAEITLAEAQALLDELRNWAPNEDEIAIAEANLEAAQASYNAARGQEASSSYGLQVVNINLEQAERDLAEAQANYNSAWDEARDWETFYDEPICGSGEQQPCTGQTWAERIASDRESTANRLIQAQDNLAIAQANYNSAVASSSSSNSTSAQSNILAAEQALEAARTGPTAEEIEAAETAVRQAELSLQQALLNQEANQISLEQAALDLESAEAAVAATELIAPSNGTITTINGAVGESVGADLITLADLSRPTLELYLDESDLNMVGEGYEVEVTFDALPDEQFGGTVVQIDPQLVQESGVTAVRAIVALDAFAKPQTMPIGLNATVEVIGGRAEDAVLVPVESLREISPGEFSIFVMEEGEPVLRFVEVGIMDFTFAEIISGVEAGEEVTTGIIQTQSE